MGGPLKLKIGQKATIGENRAQKRFTNGHKSFTAAEAKALTETQLREKSTAEVFNNNKYNMCRERNPLTGEDTPRLPQYPGIPILNTHGTGEIYIPMHKEVTGKVNFLDTQELRNEEIDIFFTQIIHQICNEFKQNMRSNSREKKFVWKKLRNITQFQVVNQVFNLEIDKYLPKFIEKIKTIFIGCDIIIDPLKTYLIIDWA